MSYGSYGSRRRHLQTLLTIGRVPTVVRGLGSCRDWRYELLRNGLSEQQLPKQAQRNLKWTIRKTL
jgi:hypothetical protein